MTEIEPFRQCPKFESCSVNVCPLDPAMLQRQALADEDRCRSLRSTRLAIAAEHPNLPTAGLTLAEIARDKRSAAAKARWEALPQAEKDARKARLTHPKGVLSGVLAATPGVPSDSKGGM